MRHARAHAHQVGQADGVVRLDELLDFQRLHTALQLRHVLHDQRVVDHLGQRRREALHVGARRLLEGLDHVEPRHDVLRGRQRDTCVCVCVVSTRGEKECMC